MGILVFRMASPLLSWSHDAKYRHRYTREDPTFSAIIGFMAAAAGVGRNGKFPQWLADIVTERQVAVRVDAPGALLRDYHTINPVPIAKYRWLSDEAMAQILKKKNIKGDERVVSIVRKADGKTHPTPVITERYYRQNAAYTIFVNDPTGEAERSLLSPVWAYYAGRKSCTLTFPMVLSSADPQLTNSTDLLAAVRDFAYINANKNKGDVVSRKAYFFQKELCVYTSEETIYDMISEEKQDHRQSFRSGTRYYTEFEYAVDSAKDWLEYLECKADAPAGVV